MQAPRYQVGVEQEQFVFREDGRVPTFADLNDFSVELATNGCRLGRHSSKAELLAATFVDSTGSVTIHNDFCTHVLELSFSPCVSYESFAELHWKVYDRLTTALRSSGLALSSGAYVELPADEMVFALASDTETACRYEWLRSRPIPSREFSKALFNALITATHIHVEGDLKKLVPILPRLYEVEYISPLLFSASSVSLTAGTIHCVRPLLWRDAFHEDYWAAAFPEIIPSSLEDYRLSLGAIPEFQRDYSFICPRFDYSTVEFRATCTQSNLDNLSALIGFRILSLLHAAATHDSSPLSESRSQFFETCRCGWEADLPNFDRHALQLANVAHLCPKEWRVCVEMFLRRVSVGESA